MNRSETSNFLLTRSFVSIKVNKINEFKMEETSCTFYEKPEVDEYAIPQCSICSRDRDYEEPRVSQGISSNNLYCIDVEFLISWHCLLS